MKKRANMPTREPLNKMDLKSTTIALKTMKIIPLTIRIVKQVEEVL